MLKNQSYDGVKIIKVTILAKRISRFIAVQIKKYEISPFVVNDMDLDELGIDFSRQHFPDGRDPAPALSRQVKHICTASPMF